MICRDDDKNNTLIAKGNISFDEISEIILRKEYLDIFENPHKENQMMFIIRLKDFIYVVPSIIDESAVRKLFNTINYYH
jgi:hypothetical protein